MSSDTNPGLRIYQEMPRPPREIVEGFAGLETNYLTDAMNRFGGMDVVTAIDSRMRMAGPAVTVRVPPGDNLMVYAAFEVAQPGDVLVIETRGYTSVAVWGDITSLIARQLGLAGMVTDGSVRDRDGSIEVGLPVFAAPVFTTNGALKDGPGEVNVPVAVGNVAVMPGDIIVGDSNGVAVVPLADAAEVLAKARGAADGEAKKIAQIKGGAVRADWLQAALEAKGCRRLNHTWASGRTRETGK